VGYADTVGRINFTGRSRINYSTRGTTKNGEGRSYPITAEIEKVLNEQLAIHETLNETGTICPFGFHPDGERIGYFRVA
jgi:hypothetical protein